MTNANVGKQKARMFVLRGRWMLRNPWETTVDCIKQAQVIAQLNPQRNDNFLEAIPPIYLSNAYKAELLKPRDAVYVQQFGRAHRADAK